jgi:hypothetical protein
VREAENVIVEGVQIIQQLIGFGNITLGTSQARMALYKKFRNVKAFGKGLREGFLVDPDRNPLNETVSSMKKIFKVPNTKDGLGLPATAIV